jgi:hypothetical protein
MAVARELRLVFKLPARCWPNLARAVLELVFARLFVNRNHAEQLRQAQNETPAMLLSLEQIRIVDAVSFAIPRVATRLPWRADCLVQALAAQRWLSAKRISSRLMVGVKKADRLSPLEAHAWLKVGERIVTGGDVNDFSPLTRTKMPASHREKPS